MRLHRYESYQQPDDDWLGELPEHWNVRRTKTMFTLQKTKVGKASADYTLLSLTLGGVIVRDMAEGGKLPAEFDAYQIVEPDDLVFCLFDIDETPRTIGIAHNHGMITGAYSVYRALPSCVPEYACYYFLHLDSFKGLRPFYTGLRKVVRADTFSKVTMPAPPLAEQKQIAAFLDYETAKIDALIEKQQQLIALLGEKRQAVISHAVTKGLPAAEARQAGLNPDAPMRDSGIEWLGEVPEHWEEYPLKVLLSLKHGYPFDSSDFNTDGEFILMTPGNFVQRGGFRPKEPEKYFTGTNFPDEFFLEEGQMLVAMTEQGPGLLGCALFVPAEGTYLHNQRLGLVQGLREDTLGERFLFHLFNSARYRAEVSVTSTGAKVQHTSPKKMLSVKVWLPPISEQNEIANFLDDRIERLETLEVKAEQTVELLQERRTALISAAVTGKIDVRGWKPPSSAQMPETEMEVA